MRRKALFATIKFMSHRKKEFEVIYIIPFLIILVFGFLLFKYSAKPKKAETNVTPPAFVEETKDPTLGLDLLGKASISYEGGTKERNKNIELGIAKINGTVLKNGEIFSFRKTIGSTTEAEGYEEARGFLNGEVVKSIGGGLCQVSTTLFQSALNSGLPITERHNHSFTVSYYDVGLDATYADPGPDLKFKNDTGADIYIKGSTENNRAIFEIYGKSDGRIASTTEPEILTVVDFPPTRYVATTTRDVNDPECINKPQIGYTSEVKYNVLFPNGESKEQTFKSNYKPLQRVCYYYGIATTTTN